MQSLVHVGVDTESVGVQVADQRRALAIACRKRLLVPRLGLGMVTRDARPFLERIADVDHGLNAAQCSGLLPVLHPSSRIDRHVAGPQSQATVRVEISEEVHRLSMPLGCGRLQPGKRAGRFLVLEEGAPELVFEADDAWILLDRGPACGDGAHRIELDPCDALARVLRIDGVSGEEIALETRRRARARRSSLRRCRGRRAQQTE